MEDQQECVPEVIENQQEFEGYDEDGRMEVSDHYIYNCERCNDVDCWYWRKYNE